MLSPYTLDLLLNEVSSVMFVSMEEQDNTYEDVSWEDEPKQDFDCSAESASTGNERSAVHRKSQFTIRKIMLWTAIFGGAVAVVGATDAGMLNEVMVPLNLAVYLAAICGLTTIVRFPKSLDSWIPLAAIPFLFFSTFLYTLCEVGHQKQNLALLVLLVSAVYGTYLLVRNNKRIKGTGFSLNVAIYHLASFIGWMVWGFIMFLFSSGWD